MNIFVVDTNPEEAARALCDQHVVKMVLETAQLLCTAFPTAIQTPYKHTHKNHPAAVWTRQSAANFEWLMQHGLALSAEYTRRYGKVHASHRILVWCQENKHRIAFSQTEQTPFVLCMPDQYKSANPVESYRAYYKSKTFARWKHSAMPMWFNQM